MRKETFKIFNPLINNIDSKIRLLILNRIDAMERELNYLIEVNDVGINHLLNNRWEKEHIYTIFIFNSIYQNLIGPIEASIRGNSIGLVDEIPLQHGNFMIDKEYKKKARKMISDFYSISSIDIGWLQATTCRDLVFRITRIKNNNKENDSTEENNE